MRLLMAQRCVVVYSGGVVVRCAVLIGELWSCGGVMVLCCCGVMLRWALIILKNLKIIGIFTLYNMKSRDEYNYHSKGVPIYTILPSYLIGYIFVWRIILYSL